MKNLLKILVFVLSFNLFSLESKIPSSLVGLWEGKDRFICFYQNSSSQNQEIIIVLKEFYGWYFDRTAEPKEISQEFARQINCATPPKSEHIFYQVEQNDAQKQIYTIILDYSKNQKTYVPIFIDEDKLYLNFWTKESSQDTEKSKNGFWQGNVLSQGFTVCNQEIEQNLCSFYIDQENLFKIKYWICDMDFSSTMANFVFEDKEFFIPKHIKSANNIYTCAAGRRRFVRNIQNPINIDSENLIFNQDFSVCVKGEPYLKRILDKSDIEYLINLINTENSKKRPAPKPLFPVKDLIIE